MGSTPNKTLKYEIKVNQKSEIAGPKGAKALKLNEGGPVTYVRVERSLDAPDYFRLHCSILQQNQLIEGIDGDFEGKPVEIALAIDEAPHTVFQGEVTYVEPTFLPGAGGSYLCLAGYDKSHRLTRGMNSRTWGDGIEANDAYSDVASAVISDSKSQDTSGVSDNLSADKVDSTSAKFPYLAQLGTSDYLWLQSIGLDAARPTAAGSKAEDGKVCFRKIDTSGTEVLTVCRDKLEGNPGQIALETRLRLSTVHQYKEVIVRAWDPKTKKAIVGKATTPDESFDGTVGGARTGKALYGSASSGRVYQVVDRPVNSKEEAEVLAQGILNRLALDFVTGEVTTWGFPKANPGDMLKLVGFGTRFSGKYLITGVVHELEAQSGYRTRFMIARNALPDPR